MACGKWQDCTIDGNPIVTPDNNMEMHRENLYAEDTGRDESDVMHLIPIRKRVGTWSLYYSHLNEEEYDYMTELLERDSFEFSIRGKKYRAYCSNDSVNLYNAKTGEYRDFRAKIIEC